MVKLILFLSFCALSAQAATYEGVKLHRVVRSPHYGAHIHYDHPPFGPAPIFPPPPPLIYRTHNWSGVGRGVDGAVKGVFSGAAAAAGSAVPAVNSAFSIAEASSANSGGFGADSAECDDNSHSSGTKITSQYSVKSSQYGSEQFGSEPGSHVRQLDTNSGGNFGSSSGYNSHSNFKESTSFSSQSGQNSASNGSGQESNKGFGGQTSSINSGFDRQFGSGPKSHVHQFDHNSDGNVGSYSGYNSHSNFKESTSFSSQSGQNSASNGSGQESNKGFGGQTSSINSGFDRQFGSGPESHVHQLDHNSGGNVGSSSGYNSHSNFKESTSFSSQSGQNSASNGSGQESYKGLGGQTSNINSGFDTQFESGTGSDVHQLNHNSGGNVGSSSGYNSHSNFKDSTSSSSQSSQNTASNGSGQESYKGFGDQTSDINSGFDKHSRGYGGYGKSFQESHFSVQNGRGNQFGSQDSNSRNSYENVGQSNYAGLNRPRAQGSSTNYDNFGASSQGSVQSGSSAFGKGNQFGSQESTRGHENFSGSGQSNYARINRPQAQDPSFVDGHFGAQGASQSGSNAFGSGSNNYNIAAHESESSKLQAGGSENFKSEQLQSSGEVEPSYEHGASSTSGQTSTNAAGNGQYDSALHGALELAAQGLQAADAKCSTCQKSSYAFSNAKSHNGAAIALSIGG